MLNAIQGGVSVQQYILLIHDQNVWETLSEEEQNAVMREAEVGA